MHIFAAAGAYAAVCRDCRASRRQARFTAARECRSAQRRATAVCVFRRA